MPNKQSGMIAFAERYAKNKVETAQLLMIQYMADTLQMTLHQTEEWGYNRIMRLCAAWKETRQEYSSGRVSGTYGQSACRDYQRQTGIVPIQSEIPRIEENQVWEPVMGGEIR